MRRIMTLNHAAIFAGAILTKEAPDDKKQAEAALTELNTKLSGALDLMEKSKNDFEKQGRDLAELQKTLGNKADANDMETVKKAAAGFAEMKIQLDACQVAVETLKKEIDQPLHRGGKDLKEHDIEAAIELQRNAFIHKGGHHDDFKADMDNLVDPIHYRSAARKMMQVGLESKAKVINTMSTEERKAFEAASLDSAFFSPQLLGIEVDCTIECAELLDLYQQITVSRSTFMYPHVVSYGDIGKYDCDAKCDAEYGPEGNITWKNGSTYDFRGLFCFNRDTLREANYDLLGFMMRAAARSYRINRNRVNMVGDGVKEPMGWLTADCFTKLSAPAQNPSHQDLRQFLASAPMEYGAVTSVMHQNTFAYFASMVDNEGRFIFGDGMMGFSVNDVRDNIRISNCLPDPTEGGTKGSAAAPFAADAFIMATGNWPRAYSLVSQRPMFMEQFVGGSTAWCVTYQFGAKDGGFIGCCPAARILRAGAAPAGP